MSSLFSKPLNLININISNTCKLCKNNISIDSSHIFTLSEQLKLKIQNYCNQCIPITCLYLKHNNIFINSESLQTQYANKQLAANGLEMSQMIAVNTAVKEFNIDKTTINYLSRIGWYKIYKINISPFHFRFVNLIERVKLEEVMVYHNNGQFIQRNQKTIKRFGSSPHAPPYNVNFGNGQFVYHNQSENKRSCAHCFEVKDINDFYVKEIRIHNYCKLCSSKQNQVRYDLMDYEERKNLLKTVKAWRDKNKDRIKTWARTPQSKAIHNIRRRVNHIIKSYKKAEIKEHYFAFTSGNEGREVIKHIESQFLEGMSWDNYGPGYKVDSNGKAMYNEKGDVIKIKQWSVDHVKPVSQFDMSNPEDIKQCNYYTNLRPMWTTDNLRKTNKNDKDIEALEFFQKYKLIKNICKNNVLDAKTIKTQINTIIAI